MKHDALLNDFHAVRARLDAWREHAEQALRGQLSRRGHDVQFIAGRTKDPDSLRHKLLRPDKTYAALWDITDLVGLRVVTSFEETVDAVAREVEAMWPVDLSHSTDKRRVVDHERFGYRSLHYICAVPPEAGLPSPFRFEIQIRTVLQHAWAEVEHDLGYKATHAVPDVIRRRFARIASLLELADQEFSSIRADLHQYQARVRGELREHRSEVAVDVVSLAELVRTPGVAALDERLASSLGHRLCDSLFYPEYLVRWLRQAGLTTTTAVLEAVERDSAAALALVAPYFEFAAAKWQFQKESVARVERGYALFFVAHAVLLGRDALALERVSRLAQAYRVIDHPDDDREAHRIAAALVPVLAPALGQRG